jgi:transposase
MIETTRCEDVSKALSLFGDKLLEIKSVSSDMAAGYLSAILEQIPHVQRVIDKFHLMQYAYDVPLAVRTKIQKELREELSEGKAKNDEDKLILKELELLKHCRYRLTQSPEKWSEAGAGLMAEVFEKYPKLKQAYDLVQDLKKWYDKSRCKLDKNKIKNDLYHWYKAIKNSGIEEFKFVVKMIRKHEYEILNYFSTQGQTNAKAERLNGKINRFIAANYGIKDKDFVLWRLAGYFA